jgi:hypothetical protein
MTRKDNGQDPDYRLCFGQGETADNLLAGFAGDNNLVIVHFESPF